MLIPETGELASAMHAWDVAGVPLPLETDGQYVSILQGPHGREGLMEAQRFAPKRYELPGSSFEPVIIDDEVQDTALITSPELRSCANDLRRSWAEDGHMRAVLERSLGYHGLRAYTHVILEMPYTATVQHRASVAYFAAKFCVERANELPELVVSLWDNGRQYPDASELRRLWTNDGYTDLENPASRYGSPQAIPGLSSRAMQVNTIVKDTVRVFEGNLTVISNQNRLDISAVEEQYRIRQSTVEPIAGNVMIARMPILPIGVRKDHTGQRVRV